MTDLDKMCWNILTANRADEPVQFPPGRNEHVLEAAAEVSDGMKDTFWWSASDLDRARFIIEILTQENDEDLVRRVGALIEEREAAFVDSIIPIYYEERRQ